MKKTKYILLAVAMLMTASVKVDPGNIIKPCRLKGVNIKFANLYGNQLNNQLVQQILAKLQKYHQIKRLNVYECSPLRPKLIQPKQPHIRWMNNGCIRHSNRVDLFTNPYAIKPTASYSIDTKVQLSCIEG